MKGCGVGDLAGAVMYRLVAIGGFYSPPPSVGGLM